MRIFYVGGSILASAIVCSALIATIAYSQTVAKSPMDVANEDLITEQMTQHRNWEAQAVGLDNSVKQLKAQVDTLSKENTALKEAVNKAKGLPPPPAPDAAQAPDPAPAK